MEMRNANTEQAKSRIIRFPQARICGTTSIIPAPQFNRRKYLLSCSGHRETDIHLHPTRETTAPPLKFQKASLMNRLDRRRTRVYLEGFREHPHSQPGLTCSTPA